MARVDSFLAQLIAYEADALVIESGNNVYLVKGDKREALLQVRPGTLNNVHVKALLDEIAPPEVIRWLGGDLAEPAVAFDHRFGTCLFHVELAAVAQRLFARMRVVSTGDVDVVVVGGGGHTSHSPNPNPNHNHGHLSAVVDVDDEPPPATGGLLRLVNALVAAGGSDLHLTPGRRPMARVDGELRALDGEGAPDGYTLQTLIDSVLPESLSSSFASRGAVEFGCTVGDVRLRCSAWKNGSGTGAAFRRFLRFVPDLDGLGMGDAVKGLCAVGRGLVIVSGEAGQGRSTTVAAMIEHINQRRGVNILTLESPVEVLHTEKRALINQRCIDGDSALANVDDGLVAHLKRAGREDADVVVCGELNTADAVRAACELADRGRLVIAQQSSSSSLTCVERLIERTPGDERDAVRALLADNLRGVIAQTLCRKSGGGRVAAVEVLLTSPSFAAGLKRGPLEQLAALAAPSLFTLRQALQDLVGRGVIGHDEAGARDAAFAELRVVKSA